MVLVVIIDSNILIKQMLIQCDKTSNSVMALYHYSERS